MLHIMLIRKGSDAKSIWQAEISRLKITGSNEITKRIRDLARLYLLAQEEVFTFNQVNNFYPSGSNPSLPHEAFRLTAEIFFTKILGANIDVKEIDLKVKEKVIGKKKRKKESVKWNISYRVPVLEKTKDVTSIDKKELKRAEDSHPLTLKLR